MLRRIFLSRTQKTTPVKVLMNGFRAGFRSMGIPKSQKPRLLSRGASFCILLSLVVALATHLSFSEEVKPVDSPYNWDFGNVKEGKVLRHVFKLKNDSATTLVIEGMQTSCGCTGSVVSLKEVPPGDTTQIKVTFNSKGYSGKVSQFVYVRTNDSKEPIIKLTIIAQVEKR